MMEDDLSMDGRSTPPHSLRNAVKQRLKPKMLALASVIASLPVVVRTDHDKLS
jgi:hypothetical protein